MRIPFRHGETILHFAARRNWTALCRWMLRLGADINRTDILGRTALHYAAQHDAVDMVRLLIVKGARLDARDWQERTPLELTEPRRGNAVAQLIRDEISLLHARKARAMKVLRGRKRSAQK